VLSALAASRFGFALGTAGDSGSEAGADLQQETRTASNVARAAAAALECEPPSLARSTGLSDSSSFPLCETRAVMRTRRRRAIPSHRARPFADPLLQGEGGALPKPGSIAEAAQKARKASESQAMPARPFSAAAGGSRGPSSISEAAAAATVEVQEAHWLEVARWSPDGKLLRLTRVIGPAETHASWLRAHQRNEGGTLRAFLSPTVTLRIEERPPPAAPVATTRAWTANAKGHVGASARANALAQAAAVNNSPAPAREVTGTSFVEAELREFVGRCNGPSGRVRALSTVAHLDIGICLLARGPSVMLAPLSDGTPLTLDPDPTGGDIRLWLVDGSLADPAGAPPLLAFAREARVAYDLPSTTGRLSVADVRALLRVGELREVTRASFAGDWLPQRGKWYRSGSTPASSPRTSSATALTGTLAGIAVVTDTIEWAVTPGPTRRALRIVRRHELPHAPAVAALAREAAVAVAASAATGARAALAGRRKSATSTKTGFEL